MKSEPLPRIVLASKNTNSLEVLKEYADFWKVPYTLNTTGEKNATILSTEPLLDVREGTIVIVSPTEGEGFRNTANALGTSVSPRSASISLPYSHGVSTFLRTTLYEFSGPRLHSLLADGENTIVSMLEGTNHHLLSVDLVSDYRRLLYGGLEDPASLKFRLITKLPFSYSAIPSFIRNRSFRSTIGAHDPVEERLGPIECLRAIFLSSLTISSRVPIPRIGFWRRGTSHVLVVTHDVETRAGLEIGAPNLARIEHAVGIRSTWNVPSDRYPLSTGHLARMAMDGEVGGHDTRHDGKLILLGFKEKVNRLRLCKSRLERLSMKEVRGFRSPLLQHGRELIRALGAAGFHFDSSVPSWEPLSPTSLRSHGVGTVFPFMIEGLVEIPVSLPQDHQLIRVGGLTPPEAVERLLALSNWVCGLGGVCVLLVHPDYEFAQPEYQDGYENLLHTLAKDPHCEVMTLGELADWWAFRSRARLEIGGDGRVSLHGMPPNELERLSLLRVMSYTSDGFSFEPFTAETAVGKAVQ